jgi:hypothetical protein
VEPLKPCLAQNLFSETSSRKFESRWGGAPSEITVAQQRMLSPPDFVLSIFIFIFTRPGIFTQPGASYDSLSMYSSSLQ